MPTPDDRYARIEALVDELAGLGADERARRLEALAAEDARLRDRVEALLIADGKLEEATFMSKPASHDWTLGELPNATTSTPEQVGQYRILRHLGTGGMGTVYLAEQREPVQRQVALKVTHELRSDRDRARFGVEAQALASMRHPNIASFYEGGTTEDGTPFVAMELVDDAMSLVAWCDHERLGIEERLALFGQVCAGVAHAHERGVLHRDLKPGNILVTSIDGRPVVKVIDFGIARPFAGAAGEEVTRGSIAGSPRYMSPEAAGIDGKAQLDTRSDVYSLGLVLCQLVAGELPYPPDETLKTLMERLKGDHAVKPSDWLAQRDANRTDEIAAARGISSSELRSALVGDLDAIVLKAIAFDRRSRYPSPRDLALDVERHLEHRPIEARPPDRAYSVGRFVRRHRVFVSASVAVLVALIVGAVATGIALQRAIAAEAVASTQRDSAEAVTDFLSTMLASIDPELAGKDVTVRALLDESAEQIGERFSEQPLVEARLRLTIGQSYGALGLLPEARLQLERGRELRLTELGESAPASLEASYQLGELLYEAGELDGAQALLEETLASQRTVLGEDHATLRSTRTILAGLHYDRGELDDALALYQQVHDETLAALGVEHPDTLSTMHNLALVLVELERWTEAEVLYRSVLERSTRLLGPESPGALITQVALGALYNDLERHEESERLLTGTVEASRRVFGAEHPETLAALNALAVSLGRQGRPAEATELFAEVLDAQRRVLGEAHPNVLLARNNLARILVEQNRIREAEEVLLPGLEQVRSTFGDAHVLTAVLQLSLVEVEFGFGRTDRARELLVATRDTLLAELGEEHPLTASAEARLTRLDATP